MVVCPRCNWLYPSELLSPLMLGGSYTPPICAICAEDIIGRPLHAEVAMQMKEDAEEWRTSNPQYRPRGGNRG